ncbi:MAG: PP2C family protein-serine/threonine phosphatase [Gammaproteobacteria bacterium]
MSGDYCDVVIPEGARGSIFFLLGDVSGKGVAASMLMAHLHAIFRSLIVVGLPVSQLIERANRVFCESTMPQHFATLVCGQLSRAGEVELCNAGHCPPLVVRRSDVTAMETAGLPLGVVAKGLYRSDTTSLAPGHTIFLYTDGLSEAVDGSGAEYGVGRLTKLLDRCRALSPAQLVQGCLEEIANFRGAAPLNDDLTVMAIRRLFQDSGVIHCVLRIAGQWTSRGPLNSSCSRRRSPPRGWTASRQRSTGSA